jgi:YVTN family beta-propeller protein
VNYSLGIDLGTTFVAAALATATRVEMFTLGDRSVVSPAVVYLREDGTLVTGEAASLRAVSSPDRAGREFKRRLGNPTPVMLGGQPHIVTMLLGTLLRDVMQKVVETEGEPPDRVLLTHPANWGPFRRALFEEVPQHAGLENPLMVTEPEAAAAHYAASRQLDDGEIMAVYDLGGGTFDATVLRKQPGGVEILGTPEGIERLGGVDFDDAILNYVDYTAGGVLRELDMRDPQTTIALARLRQDCVLAKEALSVDTETILPVFLPGRHFDVHLTRSDFEDMVRAPIESTIGALSRTLESAQVDPADLSAVLLVGGSSRIPLVARMVSAELGRPTVVDTHPKYAVALGAATLVAQASLFNGAQFAGHKVEGPQIGEHKVDGRSYDKPLAAQGMVAPDDTPAAIPTPPAAEVDSGARSRQRDTQPFVPAAGPAGAVPPPHDAMATTAAARTALGDGAAGADAKSPAPFAQPRRPQSPPPASASLPDNHDAGSEGGPTQSSKTQPSKTQPSKTQPSKTQSSETQLSETQSSKTQSSGSQSSETQSSETQPSTRIAPGTTGRNGIAPAIPWQSGRTRLSGLPSSEARTAPERRRRTLESTGALLALTAIMLGLVIFFASNPLGGPSSRDGNPLNESARIAAPPVATAVPIPAIGATIPVGKTPVFVAASPHGRQVYVANGNAQVVTVVDTAINQVTATIPIPGGPPQFLAFAPNGRKLYVTIFNDQRTIHEIAVIDTTSNTVVATVPQEARPFLPAVSPDGKRLYVPNHDIASVSVVSTSEDKEIAKINVPRNPHWVAFSHDGSRAYTANHESNVIAVIDTATLKVLTEVPVGISPHSIAVSPTGPLVANVNYDSNNVTVIDTGTLKVLETIPVGKNPRDISWSRDGRFVYTVNEDTNNVSVIDAATYKITATIPTDAAPISITVLPNGRRAYVSNKGSGTLTILELAG